MIRSCSEPNQVAQAGFELERIAVTQRVSGCYCASARASDSGVSAHRGISQMKDAERRYMQDSLLKIKNLIIFSF
jgi:hypothetical protein